MKNEKTPEQIQVANAGVERRPYHARGAARKLWSCKEDEILLDGPAGTGKTRAILEKIHFCCMKYPGMRALFVRKTRESLSETVLVTFEEKVLPPDSDVLSGPQRNLRQVYHYSNGSTLVVGGLDKSSKIMSSDYDMIGVFEATELTEEDFENLTTRLRNGIMPYHQIIADCNPGAPSHWLNRRASAEKMVRFLSRHEDNPILHDGNDWTESGAKYLKKLDRLSGARYLRLRKGIWAAAEGMVYEDWDESIHIVNRFPIPPNWRKIRTIDFGFRNPFVCQWWAINHDGVMFLYRELYGVGRTVADWAIKILRLSKSEKYEKTLADHDAEDRETLHQGGIFTFPAFKSIKPGLDAVSLRLRQPARIFMFRDALAERDESLQESNLPICTVQEFDNYVYPKGQDGKAIKEEPVDKDNHGMDAMRYAVAEVDNISGMFIRAQATAPVAVYK